jgi:hypothetical protein
MGPRRGIFGFWWLLLPVLLDYNVFFYNGLACGYGVVILFVVPDNHFGV